MKQEKEYIFDPWDFADGEALLFMSDEELAEIDTLTTAEEVRDYISQFYERT